MAIGRADLGIGEQQLHGAGRGSCGCRYTADLEQAQVYTRMPFACMIPNGLRRASITNEQLCVLGRPVQLVPSPTAQPHHPHATVTTLRDCHFCIYFFRCGDLASFAVFSEADTCSSSATAVPRLLVNLRRCASIVGDRLEGHRTAVCAVKCETPPAQI